MSRPDRRVRIDLAYDGTDFAGWQVQPRERTVQGTVEGVLARLQGRNPVRLRAAGRTDAGVHARGQVVDIALRNEMDDGELAHALRRMLPCDVRPVAVATVDDAFHSRRDAVRRTYRYRLDRTAHGDPFVRRYAMHLRRPIEGSRIAAALRVLPGRRDWSGFAGAAGHVKNPTRHLVEASFHEPSAAEAWFSFSADGFLNYMVRNLVGTLLEIGAGRMPMERLAEILESGDRRLAGPTAPARGLILWAVQYRTMG